MGRHDMLLARMPEDLVEDARNVVDLLVGDLRDFSEVGQIEIQRFLWILLPVTWGMPPHEWPRVAEAAAQLLELAWRPTLAGLARSEETKQVFGAYARSREEGIEAANAAIERTGTNPPDTDLLTWRRSVSSAEASAYDELQRVLETAIVAGEYEPGRPGWRRRQQALTERWLTTPSRYFHGERPLDVIHKDRRQTWIDAGPQIRGRVLGLVEPLIHRPVTVPAAEPEPLVWLLARIGDGVRLTQRGYLPPEIAREADALFGWKPKPGRVSRELDLPQLRDLHLLLRHHKLVAKRQGVLRLSARGRAVLEEPVKLWELAARAWLGDSPYDQAVNEVAAAMLLTKPTYWVQMAAAAHEMVSPMFRTPEGEPVHWRLTQAAIWIWLRRGAMFGFVAYDPEGWAGELEGDAAEDEICPDCGGTIQNGSEFDHADDVSDADDADDFEESVSTDGAGYVAEIAAGRLPLVVAAGKGVHLLSETGRSAAMTALRLRANDPHD
ncbi:hypothetical protein ACWDWO_05580 [Actinopolymorpha singaporensis]|uniref:Uncharacterized protein n=1 Tax=Actinopolymorpha singaporensis TaxID=117157 RepID=A0A1H1XMW4_9ACTN|nr:hypothetical protein [Actinopolymorpha singaporensis]SDT10627.1 hypothetical protein SAMN04489717_5055 [Actinopolymorpha singaporensis]